MKKFEIVHCCVCSAPVEAKTFLTDEQASRFLCVDCFEDVRKEFEKQHPGQSLRAKEEPEQ